MYFRLIHTISNYIILFIVNLDIILVLFHVVYIFSIKTNIKTLRGQNILNLS